MARYVANRLMQAIMLLVIVSAIGFAILHLAPGGPLSQFAASAQMTQEDLDRVTRQLGLDRPLPIQYLDWFGRMVRGDWGRSYRDGEPVLSVIGSHLGATLELMATATVIAILLGCWIGVLGAVRRYSLFEFAGNRRRHDRAFHSDVLVRARHDLRLFGEARLASGRQPADDRRRLSARSPASSDRAGRGAGAGRDRDVGALHALLDARGHQPGLHPHGARQGDAGVAHPDGARVAQRAAADDHSCGPSVSNIARRRAGHRDRLRLARHGPAVPQFHRLSRLSGR